MASANSIGRIEHELAITADLPVADRIVCVLEKLTFPQYNADKKRDIGEHFKSIREWVPLSAIKTATTDAPESEQLAVLQNAVEVAQEMQDSDKEGTAKKAIDDAMEYLQQFVGGQLLEVRNLTDCEDAKVFILGHREFCVELAEALRAKAGLADSGKR